MLLFIIAVRWVCRQSNHINANTTDNCYPNFLSSSSSSFTVELLLGCTEEALDGTIEQSFSSLRACHFLDIVQLTVLYCPHWVGVHMHWGIDDTRVPVIASLVDERLLRIAAVEIKGQHFPTSAAHDTFGFFFLKSDIWMYLVQIKGNIVCVSPRSPDNV